MIDVLEKSGLRELWPRMSAAQRQEAARIYFAHDVPDPVDWAINECGFIPDPWQASVLWCNKPRLFLNCSRQSGKSTTTAHKAVHVARYTPGALILLISPSLRQSSELFRKITGIIKNLKNPLKLREDNKLSLEFSNGSRIVSLPSSEGTIRGFSAVNLVIIDEASRVPDALYHALRPMLAISKGQLFLMSTPFGRRGFFYEESERKHRWQQILIRASMCPRIEKSFLEEELETLGDWWFRQEYMCNPPEAPIWMGDFSFQPLGTVKTGDTVIGWSRPGLGRKRFLIRADVLGVRKREADIVEVRMESGRVIYCTPDHKWLTMSAGHGQDFFRAAGVGRPLVRVIDPTKRLPDSLQWDAAWLGEIYDGEGSADFIAQSVNHNPAIHDRIRRVMLSLGLRVAPHERGFLLLGAQGGRDYRKQGLVDFLNWTRPTMRHKMSDIILSAHFRHADRVVAIQPIGKNEVVSLQTTTGNYVAWGYASKNCAFVEQLGQYYSHESIQAALNQEVLPLFGLEEDELLGEHQKDAALETLWEEIDNRYAQGANGYHRQAA